jgi:glycosyltransferase involved in cell wall biosynthesis
MTWNGGKADAAAAFLAAHTHLESRFYTLSAATAHGAVLRRRRDGATVEDALAEPEHAADASSLMLTVARKSPKLGDYLIFDSTCDMWDYTYTLDIAQLPPLTITTDVISEHRLAQLFRGADAFVMPTRGEGWGLPPLQAMSMALPVITTGWSGTADFATPDATFSLPLEAVEEVPVDSEYGHQAGMKWGTPSRRALVDLLRLVVARPAYAAAVGRRARRRAVEEYDDEVIVEQVLKEVRRIHATVLKSPNQ